VHKLSINGGLVNTMPGSKADLKDVDFSTPTYLQITVDAQAIGQTGNGVIGTADPPLLPRQSVISAVYASEAGNSRQLGAYPAAAYRAVFANADPSSGQLDGGKIKPLTLSGAAMTGDSITAAQIADGAVTQSKLGSANYAFSAGNKIMQLMVWLPSFNPAWKRLACWISSQARRRRA